MPTRSQVVTSARRYIGTPFHHQGRLLGVGVDCSGLIAANAIDLGYVFKDLKAYARHPDGQLEARMDERLVALPALTLPRAGMVGLFWLTKNRRPHHLGILADHPSGGLSIIHAVAPPVGKVVEHTFTDEWLGKLVKLYDYPGVS